MVVEVDHGVVMDVVTVQCFAETVGRVHYGSAGYTAVEAL